MTAGPEIAILGYHRIGSPPGDGWETWFYTSEDSFCSQLEWLDQSGITVLGLGQLLHALEEPESLPARSVALTFDDADRSLIEVALPVLLRFGFPAIAFVASDFVGGRTTFDPAQPETDVCDWDDLRTLQRCGVAVQSHGASHRAFSDIAPAERREELRRSKSVLETGLSCLVEAITYPYGDAGPAPEECNAAGYRVAFGYRGGSARLSAADPYQLPRIAMGPDTALTAIFAGQAA